MLPSFANADIMDFIKQNSLCVFMSCLLGLTHFGECKKCLKDKNLAEYPVNIYFCNDPVKTECCEEGKQFTCCEPEKLRNLKEQLILWGSVIFLVCVAVVLLICWKRDSYICEGATLKERATRLCKCGKQDKLELQNDCRKNNVHSNKSAEPKLISLNHDRACLPLREAVDTLPSTSAQSNLHYSSRGQALSNISKCSSQDERSLSNKSEEDDSQSLPETPPKLTPERQRRSWTYADKLPPLVGVRRPPTAELLPPISKSHSVF